MRCSVDVLLRAMARMVPPRERADLLEQWRADHRDAVQVGVRPSAVLLGALVIAIGSSLRAPGEVKLGFVVLAAMGCAALLSVADAAHSLGGVLPMPPTFDTGAVQSCATRCLWAVLVLVAVRLRRTWFGGAVILFGALALTVLYRLGVAIESGWTGDGLQVAQALVYVVALGLLVLHQRYVNALKGHS